MAEYDSLYISIQIPQDRLQQFFQATPSVAELTADWRTWWDSRAMYSKPALEQVPRYPFSSNRAVLDNLLGQRNSGSMEQYDAANGRWTFLALFFSENYTELLPLLALLKSLAPYLDAGATGSALVYDYYWGSAEVMAYLRFADQEALLTDCMQTTVIAPEVIQEADTALQDALDLFNKKYTD